MNIIPFTHTHIREASEIALACYNEQRFHVPDLPLMERISGLSEFTEHKLLHVPRAR